MRILAIDYGTKKIGLAISNQKKTIAFPYSTIDNNKQLLSTLQKILKKEDIEKVVVGLPMYNTTSPIYNEIQQFIKKFTKILSIPVETQDELLTSEATRRIPLAKKQKNKNRHELAAKEILEEYLNFIHVQ